MKKRKRKGNGKKARLISNVYRVEIEKLLKDGFSYRKIAQELSHRHNKHFSTGWVWTVFNSKGVEKTPSSPYSSAWRVKPLIAPKPARGLRSMPPPRQSHFVVSHI